MAPYTDKFVSIKLTRFYMKAVGFWYAESKREQWILGATLIYTIAAVIFAILVEGVDLYYSWGDLDAVTYNACCSMPLITIALKVIVFIIRRNVVVDLITFSEKNFWQVTYDKFGEHVLKNCERKGVFLLYTLACGTQCTVISYLITPLFGWYIRRDDFSTERGENGTDRNLPFRLWVDLPLKETPYYQITYVIQALSTLHSGICFFCFDNLMGILNIHIVGQFKILQHRLTTLCDIEESSETLEKNVLSGLEGNHVALQQPVKDSKNRESIFAELKECVKQHLVLIDYVSKLEDVFNLILLCQMAVSSFFICLGGFEIFVAKLSTIRRVTFVFHLMTAFFQLLLFTWTCDEIITDSQKVGEAAFYSKWYSLPDSKDGRCVRSGLMMMMIRARRPCYISAGKFSPISLQAFTGILSTTLSYFTLLRQMSEDL